MSVERAEATRATWTPVTVGSGRRRRRTLDERIAVRFPALIHRLGSVLERLPHGSRLRQALVRRRVRQGYEGSNRRDFDFVLTAYDNGVEIHSAPTGGLVAPDLVGVQRGHDGFREVWRAVLEASEDVRMEPEEMIDAGQRILVTGHWVGHGRGSGVPFRERFYEVFTFRRGPVVRHEMFRDRARAFEAAGLSE
jgi:ketosteroid isomerase-like protein